MRLSEGLGWFYMSMTGVVSDQTIVFYKRRLPSLLEHIGDVELDTITVDHLRAWRASLVNKKKRYTQHPSRPTLDGQLSPHTIHQYIRCVRRLFRWLYLEGRIEKNIAARLELPPLPKQHRRGIIIRDRDKILKVVKDNARDYAIVRLLADTACRVGGLAGLRISDLDLENRRAIVSEKGRGGNNKSRTIFFSQATADALANWLEERPEIPGCDFVFTCLNRGKNKAQSIRPITESGIYQVLKRAAKNAGINKGFNPHNFRHGAIRGWLNNGMPLSKASQLAGHSSTRITGDIYGTSNDEELAQAHDRYTWLE